MPRLEAALRELSGPAGARGGRAVSRWLLQPDLPAAGRGPRAGAAAARRSARRSSGHDMGREYRVLSRLAQVYPRAPGSCVLRGSRTVLGAPFYLMERARGVILRSRFPEGMRPSRETMRRLCETLVDELVELHAVDFAAAGLGDLGRGRATWSARWAAGPSATRSREPTTSPIWRRCHGWLAAHQPPPVRGPPDPQRLQVRQRRARSSGLDPHRRRARLGDGHPRRSADGSRHHAGLLGRARATRPLYGCFPSCRRALPGNLSRVELAERYAAKTGRTVDRHPLLLRVRAVQDRRDRPADLLRVTRRG